VQHSVYTTWRFTLCGVICRSSFFFGARSLFVFSLKLRQFYPQNPLNIKLFGLSILFAWFKQNETFCAWEEPNQVCSVFFISAPKIVTRTRLCVILTSALPWFSSKVLTSSVDPKYKHPTYPSATRSTNVQCVWLCNVAVRHVTVFWYFRRKQNKTLKAFNFKYQKDNCTTLTFKNRASYI